MKPLRRVLILAACIATALSLGLLGCASTSTDSSTNTTGDQQAEYDANNLDSILEYISSEGESASEAVTSDSEELVTLLDETYDADKVSEFYNSLVAKTNVYNSDTKEAVIDYCRCVADQGIAYTSLEDCYNAWEKSAEGFYDACEDAFMAVSNKCQEVLENTQNASDYQAAQEAYKTAYEALQKEYETIQNDAKLFATIAQSFAEGNTDVDAILTSQEQE